MRTINKALLCTVLIACWVSGFDGIALAKEVCVSPSGCYVNSSGHLVPRPHVNDHHDSGATALCRDGTESYSQHRSGTCSGHGGVARWYR